MRVYCTCLILLFVNLLINLGCFIYLAHLLIVPFNSTGRNVFYFVLSGCRLLNLLSTSKFNSYLLFSKQTAMNTTDIVYARKCLLILSQIIHKASMHSSTSLDTYFCSKRHTCKRRSKINCQFFEFVLGNL